MSLLKAEGKQNVQEKESHNVHPIESRVPLFFLAFLLTDMKYCGGGVVLAASLIIVIIYSVIKKRDVSKETE